MGLVRPDTFRHSTGLMGDETARRETNRHAITTVTCKACGVAYVQSDQDGSDYQHFCEMQTMAPPTKAPSAPASDPSSSDMTVVSPSQYEHATTQRRAPPTSADSGLPEECRQAARDPARLVKQYILVKQI